MVTGPSDSDAEGRLASMRAYYKQARPVLERAGKSISEFLRGYGVPGGREDLRPFLFFIAIECGLGGRTPESVAELFPPKDAPDAAVIKKCWEKLQAAAEELGSSLGHVREGAV